MPNYTTVTLDGTDVLTASAWDGLTTTPSGSAGYQTGIVIFRASGAVSVGSGTSISVDGLGYRGGPGGDDDGGTNGESYDGTVGKGGEDTADGSGGGNPGTDGGGGSSNYALTSPAGTRGGGGGGVSVASVSTLTRVAAQPILPLRSAELPDPVAQGWPTPSLVSLRRCRTGDLGLTETQVARLCQLKAAFITLSRGDPALSGGPRSFDLRHLANSSVTARAEYAHILALRYKEPGTRLGPEE